MLRVDSRLIHGQVIEAWLPYTKAVSIVVIDDITESNMMSKEVMKMAVPCDMKLVFSREDDFIDKNCEVDISCGGVLLLCRDLRVALKIVKNFPAIDRVNVGNLHAGSGKREVTPTVFIDDSDRNLIREIESLGVKVEIKAIPSDREVTINF